MGHVPDASPNCRSIDRRGRLELRPVPSGCNAPEESAGECRDHRPVLPAAGVLVPDTAIAREATQLVRGTVSELVYHHSRRVFWFGALQGRNRDLSFDPELLYIGALFHDLGLGEPFHGSGRRFEVDSADEARRFLSSHQVPENSIRRVWTAIALHTTPGIPQFMEPEVALVTAGG